MDNNKKAAMLCLAVLLAAGPAGCQAAGGNRIIRIWSQNHAILAFADRYNTVQNQYKIEVIYIPSPADELLIAQTVPDLILSDRLSAPRCAAKLESLNPLLHPAGVDPQGFYQELLAAQQSHGSTVALPFSFTLPVIIFNTSIFPKAPPASLSLEDLKRVGGSLNKTDKTKLVSLGFSPLWNRDFLFHTATLFGVGFHAGADGELAWDDKALADWIGYLSSWSDGTNGGFARESEFIRAYLYEPPYQLAGHPAAAARRIGLYHALVGDYNAIPSSKREALGMAWLTRARSIPADSGIFFFGIPKGSANRVGAYDFLKWTFTAENQKAILKQNAANNPTSFGIGDGFSSLVRVNEAFLPETAPFLRGRIPAEEEIAFPRALPDTWEKIKTDILIPWIYDRLAKKANMPSLKDRLP